MPDFLFLSDILPTGSQHSLRGSVTFFLLRGREAEGRNLLWGKLLLRGAIGEGSDSVMGNPHETGGVLWESEEPRVLTGA